MSLTAAQQQAVLARGNVLVMAGAGTGKTRALVERCLHCLLVEKPRVSLDEILIVTFTEAAAAEMRQRIRERLEQELSLGPDSYLHQQLALFETAHIGTLHAFCFKLVRQHFYELELDPQMGVMSEEESRLLAEETLDELLDQVYRGRHQDAEEIQRLIQLDGKGSDRSLRSLILRLHHYAQTLPEPGRWFQEQLAGFCKPAPDSWIAWRKAALADWATEALSLFARQAAVNPLAAEFLPVLRDLNGHYEPQVLGPVLDKLTAAAKALPNGRKRNCMSSLRALLDDAGFLGPLANTDTDSDPLLQEWNWARLGMATLLRLTREFGQAFARQKRELASVDFHDLEQHALQLLWDFQANRPTPIAQHWRSQLRFVFVDEYQDINSAQDKILQALSRERANANRFLVGDIKQSIYRFRLANPRIFQDYARQWRNGTGKTIPLVENFRSRQGILDFVNCAFAATMHPDLGGIEYDQEAQLAFGAPEQRGFAAETQDKSAPMELHLRIKGALPEELTENGSEGELDELAELEQASREARLVGLRLQELKTTQHPIWEEELSQFRPVEWTDMAILLRAPSGKAEAYMREFARLGIPLVVPRSGFYASAEVADLLSLMQLLDNPLQDVPLIAVLRSPFVGLSLNELALIRTVSFKAPFWTALNRWHQQHARGPRKHSNSPAASSGAADKVSLFLQRFRRWRTLARQGSLSKCLDLVLSETHYAIGLQACSRGEQRLANLSRLLASAQEFERLQRQGLFRFLRFIEAQQAAEAEPDIAGTLAENAVRLISIHQSKGLEFPVVVLADLGKPFNLADLRAPVILDDEYGLCPQISPPRLAKRYPSLPYWLAARKHKRELLGEELRLLYVAMTRARDLLVLTCSLSPKQLTDTWTSAGQTRPLSESGSCADFLAAVFQDKLPVEGAGAAEELTLEGPAGPARVRFQFHDDSELVLTQEEPNGTAGLSLSPATTPPGGWQNVAERLSWQYPFPGLTRHPAKTTVSAIRRRAALRDPDSPPRLAFPDPLLLGKTSPSAVEIGSAHHTFLQWVALDRTNNTQELRQEAERMSKASLLSTQQVQSLDFDQLAAFWSSSLGQRIKANGQFVRRELPFTFRLSPAQLAHFEAEDSPTPSGNGSAPEEFVIVQGIADLAVMLPEEIWLVDFKTDKVSGDGIPQAAKYHAQLSLYASALSLIYRRPVTEAWLWFLNARRAVPVQRG